jgi:hypothetical protein
MLRDSPMLILFDTYQKRPSTATPSLPSPCVNFLGHEEWRTDFAPAPAGRHAG